MNFYTRPLQENVLQSTVWYERIHATHACYEFRYWGYQKDLVEKRLLRAKTLVDPYRSPYITPVNQNGDVWEGFLTYWALGG